MAEVEVTCKHCGKDNLKWITRKGKHRLTDDGKTIHDCLTYNCKHCDEDGFKWFKVKGKYRLTKDGKTPHSCPNYVRDQNDD